MSPLRLLLRDLARGVVIGSAVGAVLALVFVAADFPEWSLVLWGLLSGPAAFVLPIALVLRGFAHVLARATEIGIPRERRRTQTPQFLLTLYSPVYVAGAALAVCYLVLLVAFVLGDDGRTSPF